MGVPDCLLPQQLGLAVSVGGFGRRTRRIRRRLALKNVVSAELVEKALHRQSSHHWNLKPTDQIGPIALHSLPPAGCEARSASF